MASPQDSKIAIRRLEKFGTLLPIGLDGLREKISEIQPTHEAPQHYQYLREFTLLPPAGYSVEEITGDDFLSSVLTGYVDPYKYTGQQSDIETPYCVERSKALSDVVDGVQQRYIISSDFGNGKTTFLNQLSVKLAISGRRVFFIETRLSDMFKEIDDAVRAGYPVAFLVDDVVRHRATVSYLGPRLHNQALLICTTRGDQDAQYEQIAAEMGGAHRFVDLNQLNDQEVDDWNYILERWGYWERRTSLSEDDRRKFIVDDCGRENRSIILSLFGQSNIAAKIDSLVNFFLRSNPEHVDAFCALLISSLVQRHVSWESLVGWLDINETQLRKDLLKDDVSFLFARGRKWSFLTSAQLAEYILKYKFIESERDTLVKVYSKIVLSTAESANDSRYGYDHRENLKELMKFRFLEKLFGESDASGVLIGRVYKSLSRAKRIRGNPQFWLQYSMSRIKVKDLPNAESFINTALGCSDDMGLDYNPDQILDQRARLFFMKNTVDGRPVSRNEICQDLDDLGELAKNQSYDIVYTMRSVPLIEDFLEARIDDLEAVLRV